MGAGEAGGISGHEIFTSSAPCTGPTRVARCRQAAGVVPNVET